MIATLLAVAALTVAAFALAALLFKLPREAWTLFGAALVFGLAGYAWQGSPGLPAAPKTATASDNGTGEAMVEGRASLFSRTLPPPAYIVTSDAFARRGQFADAAAILQKGLSDNPRDLEGWLALGLALVGLSAQRRDRGCTQRLGAAPRTLAARCPVARGRGGRCRAA
jgi:cytochrome c-type biogenesis protein CcmH